MANPSHDSWRQSIVTRKRVYPSGSVEVSRAVNYGPTMRIVQKSDERLDWIRYAYGSVK